MHKASKEAEAALCCHHLDLLPQPWLLDLLPPQPIAAQPSMFAGPSRGFAAFSGVLTLGLPSMFPTHTLLDYHTTPPCSQEEAAMLHYIEARDGMIDGGKQARRRRLSNGPIKLGGFADPGS